MSLIRKACKRLHLRVSRLVHSVFLSLAPISWIKTVKMLTDIDKMEGRYFRSLVLRTFAYRFARILQLLGFKEGILIRSEGVWVVGNDIRLDTKGTDRYFKVSSGMDANEGEELVTFLNEKNIEVNTFIDVGACFGEISLYFCKAFPQARILSIEASPENHEVLKANLGNQLFPTENITAINEAVADTKGTVQISRSLGSENTIVLSKQNLKGVKDDFYDVPADTLDSIMDRHGFDSADFIKVDIEGAEPMLYEALERKAGNIKAIFMEFSRKSNTDGYERLISLFFKNGFTCYDEDGNKLETEEAAKAFYAQTARRCINFWFINSELGAAS